MSKPVVNRLAWFLVALSVSFYILSLIYSSSIPTAKLGAHSALWPFDPTDLGYLIYAPMGALILTRRTSNPVGWIFLLIGLVWEGFGLTNAFVSYVELARPGSLALSSPGFWIILELWILPYGITPLLLLIFPNGRLLSSRWRLIVWLLATTIILELVCSGSSIEAGSFHLETLSLLDYFGLSSIRDSIQTITGLLTLLTYGLGVVAIILRVHRAKGEERQQLKWFTYAGVIFVLINVSEQIIFDNNLLIVLDPSAVIPSDLFLGIPFAIAFAVIPIAAAVAILRYHLYDIDIIIHRTVVYGVLTAILGLTYLGVIVLLQLIIRSITGQGSDLAIVASTLVIAALFSPLRRRVQTAIDHRFFRRRYDSEKVLAAFNTTYRDQVDLNKLTDTFLDTIEDTLQPEGISLWLRPVGARTLKTDGENRLKPETVGSTPARGKGL